MQITHHCKNGLVLSKVITSTVNAKPYICPCCGIRRSHSETDGWDDYALRLNCSRQFAILMLNKIDRNLDTLSSTKQTNTTLYKQAATCIAPIYEKTLHTHQTNAELAAVAFEALAKALPTSTHGVCYINAHCTECASTFQFTMSDAPRTHHTTLNHCPYCGTKTLVITPAHLSYTERAVYSWQVLADKYLSPPTILDPLDSNYEAEQLVRLADIQAKYHFWETHTSAKYPTFAQFIEALPTIMATELANPNQKYITSNNRPTPNSIKAKRKLRIVIKPTQPSNHPANSSMPSYTMEYPLCISCKCEQPSKTLVPFCAHCAAINKYRENLLKSWPLIATSGGC